MLRFHGSHDKVSYEHIGYNSRLDELQAAILRVQLPQLDGWADGRRAAARHYEEAGLGELVSLPAAADGCEPAWHLYVVRSDRADELAAGLTRSGIGCKAYYGTPVHRQPAMLPFAAGVELPVTDELARTHLALPMSPVLSADQAAEVVAAVRARSARSGHVGTVALPPDAADDPSRAAYARRERSSSACRRSSTRTTRRPLSPSERGVSPERTQARKCSTSSRSGSALEIRGL